jgi:tetratricopeptide (TPR) repeat protein
MIRILARVIAPLILAVPVWAQHETHSRAASTEKLGTVTFETSCSTAVRGDFNRAVALLHSFEFRSAIDAFNGVLSRDSSCAIAHWGIALSSWQNPFAGVRSVDALKQGSAAVAKARATGSPTPRERAYIDAVAKLFDNHETVPQRDRILAYERAMNEVMRTYPDDMEASIFYALALNQTALPTDKTYGAQLKAGAILEPLFAKHPDHPGLAHYLIHAYDHPPLAPKALNAAQRYAKIAPSAPHALHMPAHTFTRVGYWQDSVEANRASEQMALKMGVRGEALHAMDYQAYAYLQMAQDRAAKQVLDRLPDVMAKWDPNAIGGAAPGMAGFFASTAIAARYALERGAWQEAAQLAIPQQGTPFTIAMAHFARALGAARSGNAEQAKSDVASLAALRDKLREMKDAYWEEQVDIERRVASAWVTFAEGRKDDAIQMLRAAADAEDATDKAAVTPGPLAPARELLGDMLLEAGRAPEALVAYEATMMKEPGRFRGVYGAARAAEAAGNRTKAREYYQKLLQLARTADTNRPELQHARAFMKQS